MKLPRLSCAAAKMQTDPDPNTLVSRPVVLTLPARGGDEEAWVLRLSPGMEAFVGRYARLPGIAPPGGILDYQAAA